MHVPHTHIQWPLVAVVVADALWWAGWVVAMFVIMLSSKVASMEYVRLALIINAIGHVALYLTLLYAWEKMFDEQRVTRVVLFFAFFALFVDVYSVLDAFIHLPDHLPPPSALATVQALSMVSVIFSLCGIGAYVVLLVSERPVESVPKKNKEFNGGDYRVLHRMR
jgi:hypothetical protein